MGDYDEKSKLAICTASYCIMACGEIIKSNIKKNTNNKLSRKKKTLLGKCLL